MAWNFAALNRSAKTDKFPKSPHELLGEQQRMRRISDAESIANVKRFFEAREKSQKKKT